MSALHFSSLFIKPKKPRLLENILDIPVVTYAQAMRIAVKYSMDDVQVAIARAIQLIPLQPTQGPGRAILRLACVAEFPNHFFKDVAIQIFTDASSIHHHPTADDLDPLMPYPAFVALMMEYREGLRNPETATWTKWQIYGHYRSQNDLQEAWLNQTFGRFRFKPKN